MRGECSKGKLLFPYFLIPLISFFLFSFGCKTHLFEKNISEGVIEYGISYPKIDKNDVFAAMLPAKMIYKFKNNNTVSELSSGMGVFSTSFIINNDTHKLTHLLKLVNKKYALVLDSLQVMEGYAIQPDGMKIKLTNDTKKISGYNCKRAIVTFDNPGKNFDIYYTNEIAIKDPNWASPFSEIDGVLLEYQLKNFNIEMRLKANIVKKDEVNDKDFDVEPDYKRITKEEMTEIFQSF